MTKQAMTKQASAAQRFNAADAARFHDGEMQQAEREAFAEALEQDLALQEAIRGLSKSDALIDRALTRPPKSPMPPPATWPMLAPVGAALALVSIVAIVTLRSGGASRSGTDESQLATLPEPTERDAAGRTIAGNSARVASKPERTVRRSPVVLVVAGGHLRDWTNEPSDQQIAGDVPVAPAPTSNTADLRTLLASGNAAEASKLIATADPAVRAELAGEIARQFRSAQTLDEAIRDLPPADRLELCLLWMPDPRFRSTTLEHLSDLAAEPAIAERYETALAELWTDPTLRPWLTSYGLSPLAMAR